MCGCEHHGPVPHPGAAVAPAGPSGGSASEIREGQWYQLPPIADRPPKRWAVALTGSVLGSLTLLVALFDPRTHQLGVCPMVYFFGMQCPACGGTRATHLMVHGHFIEALHYNALWVALFPVCLYGLVAWGLHSLFRRPVIPRIHLRNWMPNAVLIAMIVFFVVRNLPIGFLHALNPPL